jgi:hypothetical protein
MRHRLFPICIGILFATCLPLFACAALKGNEITRKEAIQLAREHVDFEPETVEATKDTDNGRPVWRVIFRGKPARHPMGNYFEVLIDRRTGDVAGLAQS